MKNISIFFAALVAVLFSVAETSAQITPPYYNPANVRITGGTINGTTIGGTTAAAGAFTTLSATGNATFSGVTNAAQGVKFTTSYLGSASDYHIGNYLTNLVYNAPTGSGHVWAINNGDKMTLSATGLAVTGTLSASGVTSVTDTTDATSTTSASLKTAGGLGVAKKAYFGSNVNIAATGAALTVTGDSYLDITQGNNASIFKRNSSQYISIIADAVSNRVSGTGSKDMILNAPSGQIVNLAVADVNKLSVSATTVTHIGDMVYDKTITAGGTTGAQTINKTTGRVNFAAAATSLVVTNSLATANSICHVTKATNDATMRLGACVAAAGSITIYADVAPAAETAVNFTVTN